MEAGPSCRIVAAPVSVESETQRQDAADRVDALVERLDALDGDYEPGPSLDDEPGPWPESVLARRLRGP
jgi:hypothetical protein